MTVRENLEMGAFTGGGRETWEQQLYRVEAVFPILRERSGQLAGVSVRRRAADAGGWPRADVVAALSLARRAFAGSFAQGVRHDHRRDPPHQRQGIPVLIAEQNVRRILRLADYVYVLETGRIELEGEGGQLLADDRIRASYLGMGMVTMKIIDMHSHWGTKRGYVLQTPEASWRSSARPGVRIRPTRPRTRWRNISAPTMFARSSILAFEIPAAGEMQSLHDYSFATERAHRDVILGHWFHVDPRMGAPGVKELRRCIDNRIGFVGYAVSASKSPPGSDPTYDPFYKLCIEAGIPVLFFVGTTGLGAGLPGGDGVILDNCHPRHLDWVAAHYPELKIIAARPGWPWQTETIAVLMHKRNIWYELHGWSPKYHSADLKHDIPRRLKDRVMFGGDYPLFGYERLVKEWVAERYPPEILEKLFHRNAEAFAQTIGLSWT